MEGNLLKIAILVNFTGIIKVYLCRGLSDIIVGMFPNSVNSGSWNAGLSMILCWDMKKLLPMRKCCTELKKTQTTNIYNEASPIKFQSFHFSDCIVYIVSSNAHSFKTNTEKFSKIISWRKPTESLKKVFTLMYIQLTRENILLKFQPFHCSCSVWSSAALRFTSRWYPSRAWSSVWRSWR